LFLGWCTPSFEEHPGLELVFSSIHKGSDSDVSPFVIGILLLLPLFLNITPSNEDNGIKILSEYFVAQKERNQKYPTNPRTKMCTCPRCTAYLDDSTPSKAPNVQDNNNPAIAREQPTTTNYFEFYT
jgi:hypothetical protein